MSLVTSPRTNIPSSICLKPKALLPRGTGSKRKHIPKLEKVLTKVPFDTVAEPFGQGLWIAQALHQAENSALKCIIAAESMVDMRSIWMAWAAPWWRPEILKQLRSWQALPIEKSWPKIKETWETCQALGVICPQAAAAGLAVRILTFSGICRDTPGSGSLNIKWNKSQLKRWLGTSWLLRDDPGYRAPYTPAWPKSPPTCFHIYSDYGQVRYPSDTTRTLAFIDPPYAGDIQEPPPTRRSGRYITPAYFGHRPHAQFTYDMAVFSVRAALAAECHTVIACNYDSDRLHGDYLALASEFGYSCDRTVLGELKTLNNNARAVQQATSYQDTYWVFRKSK
ncbi:MAG: hypothetical protein AAGF93_00035 [Cyanobacteria bacterium P01_H01_bin.105]